MESEQQKEDALKFADAVSKMFDADAPKFSEERVRQMAQGYMDKYHKPDPLREAHDKYFNWIVDRDPSEGIDDSFLRGNHFREFKKALSGFVLKNDLINSMSEFVENTAHELFKLPDNECSIHQIKKIINENLESLKTKDVE